MLNLLTNPVLLLVLALLAPTASFCALNKAFFTKRQHLISLATAAILGALLGLLLQFALAKLAATGLATGFDALGLNLGNTLTSSVALLLFFLMSERFFTEQFPKARTRRIVISSIALVGIAISALFSLLPLLFCLLIYLAGAIADSTRPAKEWQSPFTDTDKESDLYYTAQTKRNVTLKRKPNIYLLVLESYTSTEMLQKNFDIDNSQFESFLSEHGFDIYRNVYSNEGYTQASTYNLMTCAHRNKRPGNAFFLDVLRENGYSCEFFDSMEYIFKPFQAEGEFFSAIPSGRDKRLHKLFSPLLSQSRYLRKALKVRDMFVMDSNGSCCAALLDRMKINIPNPRAFVIRVGAKHFNTKVKSCWAEMVKDFIGEYQKVYHKSANAIQNMLEEICKYDPDALIVAVGDHGAILFGELMHCSSNRIESVLKDQNKTLEDYAKDNYAVQLAVRWSSPYEIRQKAVSHVNLLRFALDSLCDVDSGLLDNLAPNISLGTRENDVFVRDGIPLKKIEPAGAIVGANLCIGDEGTLQNILNSLPVNDQRYADLIDALERINPDCPAVYLHKARWHAAHNNPYAIEYSLKAFELLPCFEHFAEHLAVLARLGYCENGIKFIERSNMLSKLNLWQCNDVYRCVIYIYTATGHADLAEQFSLRHDFVPNRVRFLISQGRYLEVQSYLKQKVSAVQAQDSDNSYSVSRNIAEAQSILLFTYVGLGAYEEIYKILQNATTKFSEADWSLRFVIYAMEKLGKCDEAFALLCSLLQKQPGSFNLSKELGLFAIRNKYKMLQLMQYVELAYQSMDLERRDLEQADCFEEDWYRFKYMDSDSDLSPIQHYLLHGVYMGASPAPWFNSLYYLYAETDIYSAGIDPFIHYLKFGRHESRYPRQDISPTMLNYKERIAELTAQSKINIEKSVKMIEVA